MDWAHAADGANDNPVGNRRRIMTGFVAALVLATGVLSGCDDREAGPATTKPATTATTAATKTAPTAVAELPPATVVTRAESALRAARSLQLTGTVRDGKDTIRLDLAIHPAGSQGTIVQNGLSLKLILLRKVVYVQMSEAMLRKEVAKGDEGVVDLLRGRWLKTSAGNPDFADLVGFADYRHLADWIFEDTEPPYEKAGQRTVNGVRCVGVKGAHGTWWLDAATSRPVRLEAGAGEGAFDLSRYGAVPPPQAPPKRLVIDADKLGS